MQICMQTPQQTDQKHTCINPFLEFNNFRLISLMVKLVTIVRFILYEY